MVLAIGLVVDDAIVVVENIHRHIEEGLSPVKASLLGAREIVWPVVGMTITLAAVYAPIGMMGGVTGALFKEFAFTLACSVIVSGVVALTLSPMMSSYMLDAKMSEGRLAQIIDRTMTGLANRYGKLLSYVLHARAAVLFVCVAILAGIVVLFMGVNHELAPGEDQGYVFVQTKSPQYASVDYTEQATLEVENVFRQLPDYQASFFVNGLDGQNSGFGGVVLTPWDDRKMNTNEVEGIINGQSGKITGAFATAFQPAPLPAGSGGLPVQMILRAPSEFSELYKTMEGIKGAAWGSGLFAFVDSNLAFDSPQAQISINASKAGEMGVSMNDVAETLAVLVGENYINRFNWFDRSYDVITQVPQSERLAPDDLSGYYVRAQSGEMVPLSTVVDIKVTPQANRLPQFNQMNAITLSGVLLPGVTMGQAVEFLQAQPLPPGAQIDWMSDSRQFVKEGNRLIISFGFALIVIFLVLAAQYESFKDPLVILITVPLAICGALIPLWLGFATMNIYTQIGLVTLIGLISKHGILMVSFANDIQKHQGLSPMDAMLHAAMIRMRPVLMTTAAMVSGLIPLMFATGAGAASRYSIGLVVVTGLLIGTFLHYSYCPLFTLCLPAITAKPQLLSASESYWKRIQIMHKIKAYRAPKTTLLSLTLMLALGGCSLAPEYKKPENPVSASWISNEANRIENKSTISSGAQVNWQEFVKDRHLAALIELALNSNRDLKQTLLNVKAARAQYGIQRADTLPTIAVQSTATRQRTPEDLRIPGMPSVQNTYRAGVGFTSFELDFRKG